MLRLVDAALRAGRSAEAEALVRGVLATSPRDRAALRLAAGFAARRGDWAAAAETLGWLARTGSGADARVQADLAFALMRSGDGEGARHAGEAAYRLQRGSLTGTQAWAAALGSGNSSLSNALAEKSRALAATGGAHQVSERLPPKEKGPE
jgi:hypothetical protein